MEPFLPPIGGVSVHVSTVITLLKMNGNTVYQVNTVADYHFWYISYCIIRFVWILLSFRSHIIYYHHSHKSHDIIEKLRCALCIFFKVIMQDFMNSHAHDCRHLYVRSKWYKKLYSVLINRGYVVPMVYQHKKLL
jgi:hypothetical protein